MNNGDGAWNVEMDVLHKYSTEQYMGLLCNPSTILIIC